MPDAGPRTDPLSHDQRRARRPAGAAPLRRSDARVIAGVAGGIAAFVGTPAWLVRALFAASVLPSIGITVVGYLLLWWLLPPARPRGNRGR